MAQQVDEAANLLVTVGGWAVAILIGLFTFIAQWRRGGVEEISVVLGKWKDLVEAHERQLAGLAGETKALRARVDELENSLEDKEDEILRLRKDLAGERKNMRQQAQSFREQLVRLGHNDPDGVLLDGSK